MVDKIIEELVGIKSDITSTNEVLSLVTRTRNTALEEAIEIVKKYEDNNWIKTKDQLPPSNYNLCKCKEYLTCNINNVYMLLPYCEGWNCTVDENGRVYKVNEIYDIIAWREIEEYEGE